MNKIFSLAIQWEENQGTPPGFRVRPTMLANKCNIDSRGAFAGKLSELSLFCVGETAKTVGNV
jgi:hypothetical protein